ncbi:MAG: CoA transferase subunit A [Solirubrobacterales bacterium]
MPIEKTAAEIAEMIESGATLMIGGFLAVGTPETVVDAIVVKGIGSLTGIGNDTAFPGVGIGKLVRAGLLKKMIASHVGTNPETTASVEAGRMELELVPQGTLAERIRAGGAGLGGILTPTGVGTDVARGKTSLIVDGREYLLELPMNADFALIHAECADVAGNLQYVGTTRNFNPIMAAAGKVVVAEVNSVIDGFFDPDQIHTPGILVDYIVRRDGQ